MKRYWIRIALGALGIFVVGMVLVSAGRRGVEKVSQLAMEHTVRLTRGVAPFQIDNRRLGTLTEVRMDPDRSQDFPFISLTVQLDSTVPRADLEDCILLASDLESVGDENGIHCSQGVSRDSLVEMGEVTFEPSGEQLSIYVPSGTLDSTPWFNHSSRSGRPASNQGSFNLRADSAGAFMLIKDEKGRPVFQLNADSQGAFIQIRDSNGKEVVRFRADQKGVIGNFNSD
jgi:hypothetical protein